MKRNRAFETVIILVIALVLITGTLIYLIFFLDNNPTTRQDFSKMSVSTKMSTPSPTPTSSISFVKATITPIRSKELNLELDRSISEADRFLDEIDLINTDPDVGIEDF